MKKLLLSLALIAVATFGLAACSTSVTPTPLAAGTVVVDVRTPAEFAQGHLTGAVNIDVESSAFTTQVKQLPTTGTYVVYCRSGNRATAAISQMKVLGYTQLTNAGGITDAAASTGLSIVTGP
jgi:phage shock protein E